MKFEVRDIDRKIWKEELSDFIPQEIYDIHVHVCHPEHCLTKPGDGPSETMRDVLADRKTLNEWYADLFPGRKIHYITMPWVFRQQDFEIVNKFAAAQSADDPLSVSFMLIHPDFTPDYVSQQIESNGFRGLKPYRFFARTGDEVECRITDMLPEPLIELANEKKLVVMMHLGKSLAIADEENIKDLTYLTKRYPNVKWVMAHMARSMVPWPLERAIDRIKDLSNLWYDFSSVCESDVYTIAFKNISLKRIVYGSDIPCDLERGKMVGFGFAWADLNEKIIADMNINWCDPRPTFVMYETLRAFRNAVLREGIGRDVIEDIFYNNAIKLLNL